jgi:prophage regulatory protein
LQLPQVIGSKKRCIPGMVPMSKSKFYAGIKQGIFPAPIHIGSSSYWRKSDIVRLIENAGTGV